MHSVQVRRRVCIPFRRCRQTFPAAALRRRRGSASAFPAQGSTNTWSDSCGRRAGCRKVSHEIYREALGWWQWQKHGITAER